MGGGGGGGLKKKALSFKQILSTNSLTKCMKICVENLYLYIGAHGVRVIPAPRFSSNFTDRLFML